MNTSLVGADAFIRELKAEFDKKIKALADEVNTDVKSNTPIRTGNARRGWNKKVKNDGFTVENRVPYIERLEAGASRQAPKGIIGPTLSQIKGKV